MEAQEMEEKLTEQQSVCNETMQALWEECKPCLRKACVKYYSRTCSSGAGLVGRQVIRLHKHSCNYPDFILVLATILLCVFLAGGPFEQDLSHLHLDQRAEH